MILGIILNGSTNKNDGHAKKDEHTQNPNTIQSDTML